MRNKVNKFTKNSLLIPVLCLPLFLGACAGTKETVLPEESFLSEETERAEQTAEAAEDVPERVCFVHVCGAVKREGVYELPEGSRVFEAIAAAGGLLEDAEASAVNQAQLVADGSRLRIPFAGESAADRDAAGTGNGNGGLIDINTATLQELQTLSGIGPKRAQDIIRYRETHGAFLRIEDLMRVDGIKQKLFEQIREQITV